MCVPWIGNNYCNDENNNIECEWDGGDCCGDNVNIAYCTFCQCLDPTYVSTTTTIITTTTMTTTTATTT